MFTCFATTNNGTMIENACGLVATYHVAPAYSQVHATCFWMYNVLCFTCLHILG